MLAEQLVQCHGGCYKYFPPNKLFADFCNDCWERKFTSFERGIIVGINVPALGETWQELNEWRVSYGLKPVVRKGIRA